MLNQVSLLKHFCDTLWEYDPAEERVYIYHDTMVPELCGQWVAYRALYEDHLKRFVYREDVGIWKRYMSPEAFLRFLDENAEESGFVVRMEHTNSGLQWHEAYLQRYGDHILVGSRDIKEEQRNATITKAILPEFDYVCRIDVRTGSYVLYYADDEKTVVPQHEADDYEQVVETFNREYVVPEEADALTANMRIQNLVEKLREADEYVLYTQLKADINPQNSYKRLRFRYADASQQVILLTRTDVSETFRERKKSERIEKHYRELLTNMPIAICSTQVLLDANGQPRDFKYTYCNPAHEKLEGVQPGELVGKGFYEFFDNSDPKWLQYYYETAWHGIPHVIREYSPEIGKDLLIHTFRTEPGHCDCVVQDVTQENFLLRELHQSREEIMRVLETTTTAVFQYNPVTDEIQQNDYVSGECSRVYHIDELFELFAKTGRIEPESISLLKDTFSRVRKGEHSISIPLRCTKRGSKEWLWFKLSLFDYQDENSKERKVLGYIQDINRDMTRQAKLLAQAQTDALTGILNVGAGRSRIQKLLSTPDDQQKAMFMMDVDNFKIVNDTYGHMMGDKTLKRFAEILSTVFTGDAVVFRLGGDEFSVFLPQLQNAEVEIAQLVKKLNIEVQKAKAEFPFLSISVGIYITDSCESYEQYYAAADKALYQTKKSKKGCYTVLNDSKKF